jgi:hypothetical protein
MHGYAGPVERKIRLWVVQQERKRRKERAEARGATAAELPRRTSARATARN